MTGSSVVRPSRRTPAVLLYLLAVCPLFLALLLALRAPRMHVLLDYWHVLAKITGDDGSLLPGMVFGYHLDQPFVLPSLLFWADAAWFGGDNRVLTVLTVAMVAAVVVLLHLMLPATTAPVRKAALTAGFAFLLLSSHAAELWSQGTNGISWVPAVLLSVLAIALAHRGRFWPAVLAAAFGCLSFSAAFGAWFALALIFWLRRDARYKVLVPPVAGVLVLAFWFLTKPSGQQSLATSAFDPDGRLSVVLAAIGGLWSADVAVVAVLAGGLTLALLVLPGRSAVLRRVHGEPLRTNDSGWIGLAAYAVALAVMLGLGRTTAEAPSGNAGLISRYVLVAALATCALLALAALHRPAVPTRYVVIAVVAVGLVTHAIGGTKADAVRRAYEPLRTAAVALRLEAPEALAALHIQPSVIPAARALGGYPFTDDFTLGCHGLELGGHVELAQAWPSKGAVESDGALLTGWATVSGSDVDCVLVTDEHGTVVGGGVTGLTRPGAPGGAGWQAVAAPGTARPQVLVSAGGALYRVAGDPVRG
ncbi:DUF2079 domain-containing protein [Amycolatopsis nigrescens]|uniref:DUF2079 domain-containing protein n=1 Tax=Amycolatopsis nigrescens TaxID=381445 RepID=UPI0012FAE80C|nr:DUF2079 domain-containing protein [Amycolatopsis nigrescens]